MDVSCAGALFTTLGNIKQFHSFKNFDFMNLAGVMDPRTNEGGAWDCRGVTPVHIWSIGGGMRSAGMRNN